MTGIPEAEVIKYIIEGVKFVAEQVHERIRKANALIQDDVKACGEYLQAAMHAINGLENARIQLLNETKWLEASAKPDLARLNVAKTIDELLRTRDLLPELQDAIVKIQSRAQSLRRVTEGFIRSHMRGGNRRRELISHIETELNNLTEYLNGLKIGVEFTQSLAGIDYFIILRGRLDPNSGCDLAELTRDAAMQLDIPSSLDSWRHRVMILIEELRIAFR